MADYPKLTIVSPKRETSHEALTRLTQESQALEVELVQEWLKAIENVRTLGASTVGLCGYMPGVADLATRLDPSLKVAYDSTKAIINRK